MKEIIWQENDNIDREEIERLKKLPIEELDRLFNIKVEKLKTKRNEK